VTTLKEILKDVGMDEDRILLRWIAGSEAEILKRGWE
jgi:coenzyme F420-reducing hydrogenase delta subunit